MLVQISPTPTEKNSALLLHAADNIAIARVTIPNGQRIECGGSSVTAIDSIPAGHKIAISPIQEGQPVRRYGEVIGFALRDIKPGEHIHQHNLGYTEIHSQAVPGNYPSTRKTGTAHFLGFPRESGRAGTRNYIAVVAASNCAAHSVELIARSFENEALPENVNGVVAFPHGDGCAQSIGPDTEQLQRTLEGVLDHPNVAAAIIVGLGCEVNQIDHYLGRESGTSAPSLVGLTLQNSGGTRAVVEEARKQVRTFIDFAASIPRTEVPASALVVGLNCGGSDSFSGITANPALGFCCDLLVEEGGTVVLAETPEIVGAEHLLIRRAKSEAVAHKLLGCIEQYKAYLRQFGGSFNDNPSPGNKMGGLTNIIEKSLGAVAKAGTTALEDVFEYAERIRTTGFVFMNTPGYDPVSLAGLAAGGANMIVFTTGRGSAIGFPSVPTLKVASNSATFHRMPDNMDINAGRIADGTGSIEEVGREIFNALLRSASGEPTKAELLGHHEFVPWKIGPTL